MDNKDIQNIKPAPSNAPERQMAELAAILGNERTAKNAARSLALRTLYMPIERPKPRYFYTKDGQALQTEQSILEQEAWDRCKALCKPDQNPTMWDVMNNGQAFSGITNSANFVALRDTAGLKPIDETKLNIQPDNPYEHMTDEELLIAKRIQDMSDEERAKFLESPKPVIREEREDSRGLVSTTLDETLDNAQYEEEEDGE